MRNWIVPLLAGALAAAAPAQDPAAVPPEYRKLVAEYDAAVAASKSSFVVAPVDDVGFARRAMALAEQAAGEAQVPFLVFAALHAGVDRTIADAAVRRLQAEHARSAQLTELLEGFQDVARRIDPATGKAFLAAVLAENQNKLPRAWALYLEARRLQADPKASEEEKAAANARLAEAETLAAGTALAELLASPRSAEEKLKIGMTAPDIEGQDTDGVAFKLSDYRGKVVVLDFWGFW